MPRHRSLNLKKFIESIPEAMLKEYFDQKIKAGPPPVASDYDSMSDWLDNMPDKNIASSIEEDFKYINDICEKVMNYVVRAYQRYRIDMTGEESKPELAINLFLHHKEAFDYAYDYYCLYNSSSKMSHHNIKAPDKPTITDEKISRFRKMVSDFYFQSAKGQECEVRCYDEEEDIVIVVLHGSYKQSKAVWDGERVKTLFFRPANEDILRFNKNTSLLFLKAPYKKDKENYILAFTEAILQDESQAKRVDRDATYTLEPLQKGTFSFDGNENIVSIVLKEIKLVMRGFTIPAVVVKSSDVLETLQRDLQEIRLDSGDLVHAKFEFKLEIEGKRKRVTFEITPPNVTDLTRKKYADIIGAYLKENGVKLV